MPEHRWCFVNISFFSFTAHVFLISLERPLSRMFPQQISNYLSDSRPSIVSYYWVDTFIICNINTRKERVQAFGKEGHDLRGVNNTDRARAQEREGWGQESNTLVQGWASKQLLRQVVARNVYGALPCSEDCKIPHRDSQMCQNLPASCSYAPTFTHWLHPF